MDDVSKLQKINNIARELMKHGQATSMDQAMRMATEQVESGTAPEMPPAPEAPAPEAVSPPAAAPLPDAPETPEVPSEASADDLRRLVEDMAGKQQTAVSNITNTVNAHTNQITDLTNKITKLVSELAGLKDEVRRLRESPVTAPLPKKEAATGQTQFKQESAPAPAPAPEPEKKPDGSGHARSGNYQPGDVSIEKFFYYGK